MHRFLQCCFFIFAGLSPSKAEGASATEALYLRQKLRVDLNPTILLIDLPTVKAPLLCIVYLHFISALWCPHIIDTVSIAFPLKSHMRNWCEISIFEVVLGIKCVVHLYILLMVNYLIQIF